MERQPRFRAQDIWVVTDDKEAKLASRGWTEIGSQMLLARPKYAAPVLNGIVFVLLLATLSLSLRLKAQQQPILFQQTHRAMGTVFTIDLYAADEQTAALIAGAAFDEVDRLDDNVQVVLTYSECRRFIFTSLTGNSKMGSQFRIYGTRGSLNVTLEDATFFYEPAQIVQLKTVSKGEEKGVTTGASYRPGSEMPYRGPGKAVDVTTAEDPTTTATRAFIYCVRTGTEPISNVHTGLGSALAVVQADQARQLRKEVEVRALA